MLFRSVSPSKDYYLRRAFADPRFKGIDDGVVIMKANGAIEKRRGSAVYTDLNEKLLGGWAIVYVDGFVEPMRVEVSMAEYDQKRALWNTKPATMIVKVADSQCLRKAFPDLFTGTYDQSELWFEPQQEAEPGYEVPDSGGGWEECGPQGEGDMQEAMASCRGTEAF
nr:recombinase RecT [Adlercreutzia caecimuris]